MRKYGTSNIITDPVKINSDLRAMTRLTLEDNYGREGVSLPGVDQFENSREAVDNMELGFRERMVSDDLLRRAVYRAFTNNGMITPSHRLEIPNALSQSDLTRFIPETIVTIIREALEPETYITDMVFQKLAVTHGVQVNLGSIGAIAASIIAEGTEAKTVTISMGDGEQVVVNVKKHGVNIAVTEEVITYSQWDVLGVWLRAVGRGMARHKERQAIEQLNTYGTPAMFDNKSPTTSVFGNLTGRNIAGVHNGSFTANDLMRMYGHMVMNEFLPDTIIMHPLAWAMWATDPELREIVISGSRVTSVGLPAGAGAQGWPDPFGGRGLRTRVTGQTTPSGLFGKIGIDPYSTDFSAIGSTWQIAPRYMPTPLRVIVSPLVTFTSSGGATDTAAEGYPTTTVTMLDSSETGILVYPADMAGVYLEEWDEPARAIKNLGVRERYAFQVLNQGKSIGTALNAVIAKNYVFENVNSTTLADFDASGSGLAS